MNACKSKNADDYEHPFRIKGANFKICKTFSLAFTESYVKRILFHWKLNHVHRALPHCVQTFSSYTGWKIMLYLVMPCSCYFQHYPAVQFLKPGATLVLQSGLKRMVRRGLLMQNGQWLSASTFTSMLLCLMAISDKGSWGQWASFVPDQCCDSHGREWITSTTQLAERAGLHSVT